MVETIFPPNDFLAYWSGFHFVLQGGNPYDHYALAQYQQTLGPFSWPGPIFYQPILFVILGPLLSLPLPVAQGVWALSCIALTLWCLVTTARLSNLSLQPIEAATIGVIFPPCAITLIFGQLSILVCASALLSVLLLLHNRPVFAGLAILPALLKPHLVFLLLVPIALNGKGFNFKFILGVVGGYLLNLLAVELLRPGILASYLRSEGSPLEYMGHSPVAALRLMAGPEYQHIVAFAPAVLAILMVFVLSVTKRINLIRDTPLLLCFSTLMTPYIWIHDFTVLLPAVLRIYSVSRQAQVLLLVIALIWWGFGLLFGFNWWSFIFSAALTALTWLTQGMARQATPPCSAATTLAEQQ